VASEAHERVELVDFHVVDAPIHAVNSLQNERHSLQLRHSRRALEDFSLDYGQVSSFNCQDKRMV